MFRTPLRPVPTLPWRHRLRPEDGMSTVEYAVGTIAAAAFAAVLYAVVTDGSVATALGDMVKRAFSVKL